MKNSTPILDIVRAMHAEQDARGHDPYNHGARRHTDPVRVQATPAQVREAEQNLKCYETELVLS
jgi:hypothetical protein